MNKNKFGIKLNFYKQIFELIDEEELENIDGDLQNKLLKLLTKKTVFPINYNVPQNKETAQNENIKLKEDITGKRLLLNGFKKKNENIFYYNKILLTGNEYEDSIELNISVNLENKTISIGVIDFTFFQNYDYQALLKNRGSRNIISMVCHYKVQKVMERLLERNIITNDYKLGDYI